MPDFLPSSPQPDWRALLATILGGGPPEAASALGTGEDNQPTVAATPPFQPPNTGGSLPPGLKPSSGVPTLQDILAQNIPVPKRRPLDYLLMAASPAVAGLTSALMQHRKSDRNLAFWTGVLGGGAQVAAHEASRKQDYQNAVRQRMIEDILLQQKVRGTPVETGVGPVFPGTGEVIPGGPKPVRGVQPRTIYKRDEAGNEIPYSVDTAGNATPITETDTGTKQRVPLVRKPTPEKPGRELRVGKNDHYYWIEQGKDPVDTGVERPESEKQPREGDIARAEKKQVNDAALTFLDGARKSLGTGKKPEEYVNEAVNMFQRAAKDKKDLRGYGTEITSSIRTIGKSVKSEDELAQLVSALLGTSAAAGQK